VKQKVSKGRRGSVTKHSGGEYSTLELASGTRDHQLGSEIPSSAIYIHCYLMARNGHSHLYTILCFSSFIIFLYYLYVMW